MEDLRDAIRRAFASFLALPTAVISLFAVLAFLTNRIDHGDPGWLDPIREFMGRHVFGSQDATGNLLSTIAGGMLTITSITFSLLLLALQQSASSMTHDVFDQFLRRRANQVYFGYFIGLTMYTLLVLATVDPPFNPVIGASLALILAIAALYVLLLLIYTTIDQMRPTEIIRSIHDITLHARDAQRSLIQRTRSSSRLAGLPSAVAKAPRHGYMVGINLDAIGKAVAELEGDAEITYLGSIGAHLAYGDPIAEVRAARAADAGRLVECVRDATHFDHERDVDQDPAFGIEQIATIAWRSISTSQQSPAPGIAAVDALHDLLARWVAQEPEPDDPSLPVVYPDNVMEILFDELESLTVVASEAMQPQTYAAVLDALAVTFDRLGPRERDRTQELVMRSLASLGDHVLTRKLDEALAGIADAFERAGLGESALSVRAARDGLAESIGKLNSHSTRVPDA